MAELTGKLQQVIERKSGTGKNGTWGYASILIKTDEPYPKTVCLQAWDKKGEEPIISKKEFTHYLAGTETQIGDTLKIQFYPESRVYNEKYYTDLKAYKIEVVPLGNIEESINNDKDNYLPF